MNVRTGIPGMILLPAREYKWELVRRVSLKVPNQGKISDLLSKQELASGVQIPGDDEFVIFEDGLFLVWEAVRVLFADVQYPALEEDECFNVVGFELQDDDIILIHGEILKSGE